MPLLFNHFCSFDHSWLLALTIWPMLTSLIVLSNADTWRKDILPRIRVCSSFLLWLRVTTWRVSSGWWTPTMWLLTHKLLLETRCCDVVGNVAAPIWLASVGTLMALQLRYAPMWLRHGGSGSICSGEEWRCCDSCREAVMVRVRYVMRKWRLLFVMDALLQVAWLRNIGGSLAEMKAADLWVQIMERCRSAMFARCVLARE